MSIEDMRTKMMLDKAEYKGKIEVATNLLKMNMSVEEIIKATELSKKTIEELQQKLLINA